MDKQWIAQIYRKFWKIVHLQNKFLSQEWILLKKYES